MENELADFVDSFFTCDDWHAFFQHASCSHGHVTQLCKSIICCVELRSDALIFLSVTSLAPILFTTHKLISK